LWPYFANKPRGVRDRMSFSRRAPTASVPSVPQLTGKPDETSARGLITSQRLRFAVEMGVVIVPCEYVMYWV
jgi:hypothetical protein